MRRLHFYIPSNIKVCLCSGTLAYIDPKKYTLKQTFTVYSFLCPSTFYCGQYDVQYGISGCGVFKAGIQNQEGFWLKINCIQMKLPNFENLSNGELSKSTKI